MNGFRIRAAEPADAETIARVHVQCWFESYRGLVPDDVIEALSVERNQELWAGILGDEDAAIAHVAECQGQHADVIGFGAAADARNAALGASGEVTAIYVLDAFKRRGVGRALFTGLMRALAARGHRSAGLWVLVDNHRTRRFYEALGGRAGARRVASDGPVVMHEIAYIWSDLSGFAGNG